MKKAYFLILCIFGCFASEDQSIAEKLVESSSSGLSQEVSETLPDSSGSPASSDVSAEVSGLLEDKKNTPDSQEVECDVYDIDIGPQFPVGRCTVKVERRYSRDVAAFERYIRKGYYCWCKDFSSPSSDKRFMIANAIKYNYYNQYWKTVQSNKIRKKISKFIESSL